MPPFPRGCAWTRIFPESLRVWPVRDLPSAHDSILQREHAQEIHTNVILQRGNAMNLILTNQIRINLLKKSVKILSNIDFVCMNPCCNEDEVQANEFRQIISK